jgi:hypothetical protein
MKPFEFFTTVQKMRAAQKAYFKDRKQSDLIQSKQPEKIVDQALLEGVELYQVTNDKQEALF